MNPVTAKYTFAAVLMNFVSNQNCSQALEQSAKTAYLAKTGLLVNQTFNTQFLSLLHIITSLTCIQFFTSDITCYYYNN